MCVAFHRAVAVAPGETERSRLGWVGGTWWMGQLGHSERAAYGPTAGPARSARLTGHVGQWQVEEGELGFKEGREWAGRMRRRGGGRLGRLGFSIASPMR